MQIAQRLLLSADLFPRVREIQLSSATTSAEWDALLQHPSLSGLTSLCARGDGFVESHMRLLTVGHTQLRTLRFSSVVPQTVSGLLCMLPLLTDVAVAPCWSFPVDRLMIDSLAECACLRRISLCSWSPSLADAI